MENKRKVDCKLAARGVWLVKVPRYLSELWSGNEGAAVGNLLIHGDPKQGACNLELISKPGLADNLQVAKEKYGTSAAEIKEPPSHLQNAPEEHSFVFQNAPGHVMTLIQEDKTNLNEDAAVRTGKLSIQGRVAKRADCRPNDSKYMRMKIEQIHKSQKPQKFVQQLDRAAVKYKPISNHDEALNRLRQKKEGAKLHRGDEDSVRQALFQAFERHQYYRLHDLQQLLQQPAGYLKEILSTIATYNTGPPHKSMWELKPEYRNYSIKTE